MRLLLRDDNALACGTLPLPPLLTGISNWPSSTRTGRMRWSFLAGVSRAGGSSREAENGLRSVQPTGVPGVPVSRLT